MNILETLISKNVAFAVIVNKLQVSPNTYSREYEIIVASKDNTKVRSLGFFPLHGDDDCGYRILVRELSSYEIEIFKKQLTYYVKILHSKYGRVYEYKANPFKSYYNKHILNHATTNNHKS